TIKKIAPDSEPPGTPEYTFRSRLEWQIDQLAWVTDGVKRATELVNEAQNGGGDAAKKFTAAGNELTASIFGLKALAILLAYDDLEYEVEREYPHTVAGPRNAAERMHHEFASVLGELRVWESGQLNQAVNTIVSTDWSFDFGAVKDLAEEQIQ